MTTEAEEFKKQKERFSVLAGKFNKIYDPNTEACYMTFVYESEVHGTMFGISFSVNDRPIFRDIDSLRFYKKSAALRALNDRLELALQGKLKDADT